MRLLLATTSRGKLREQHHALAGVASLTTVSLESFPDIEAPEETGDSFLANARAKAFYYHRATGLPALGEDSGLEIEALDGEPGIHSARWLGPEVPYAAKNARILELLEGLAAEQRGARFISAVAIVTGDRLVFDTEASCVGRIAEAPQGEGGFGYDPIFYYPPLERTLAEVTPDEKNEVSHRGRSMKTARDFLVHFAPGFPDRV